MNQNDVGFTAYQQSRQAHWDGIAQTLDSRRDWSRGYYERLVQVYRFWAPPGQRILEVGCGTGNLLSALAPEYGLGVDFSREMISRASKAHPELDFLHADAHNLQEVQQQFDIIILSDLVDDIWDVQQVFVQLKRLCHPRTRLIINSYSRLWELPLFAAAKCGLAKPRLPQNWLTVEDITGMLQLVGFEVIRSWQEVLWPLRTPGLSTLFNKWLVKIWPFRILALTNFMMARPLPEKASGAPAVSVIVPARNESGNIARILDEIPQMGAQTELVFVEGHSQDDTYETIEKEISARPLIKAQLHRQAGEGKGDAVRLGFSCAKGDILMILDADLTVPPEDLPRFYEALLSGKGEFINGVRLVYPMEQQAMRFFNFLGNKFFSLAFSWLLGQPIKDTLCGTKVLWKKDYELIAANRSYFGNFDPFGDYDLIFGAAKLGMKIVDLPIRYRARTYGTTNIQRWRHGFLLLRMMFFAARRIKFQ